MYVNLIGRLTRDPELHTLPSGTTVCNLRVADDELGAKGATGYIDVATWGKPGEAAARVLSKGWLVAVNGRLEQRTWTDDQDRRHEAYRVVGEVKFLAAPRSSGGADVDQAEQPDRDGAAA